MNQGSSIAFHTLGCKLNYSESSSISRRMEEEGFEIVDFSGHADIYVINTCSVTENANKKCRNFVRKALRSNKDAYVVVIGCYAQLKPKEISEIEGVDLVLGAAEKFQLPHYLKDLSKNPCGLIKTSEIGAANFFVDAYSIGNRTRSFLKIQDGCDYKCSFCTIPLARGKSRSDTMENILKNAQAIAKTGVKEIVLTGVNIGDYGKGLYEDAEFLDVIKMLDEVENIHRIRISSIEPNLLKDEIIEFVAQSKRFMPHFHIPLQSGSDKMLSLMRRRYKKRLYEERVEKIKSVMPHACIGVDVIVGFPGETTEDFLETYEFLNNLEISYLHVFTFSERENTDAMDLDGKVPKGERAERSNMLRILSEKKLRAFYAEHIGSVRKVLFEEENKGTFINGFTDNYIKVAKPYKKELVNTIDSFAINAVNESGLVVE